MSRTEIHTNRSILAQLPFHGVYSDDAFNDNSACSERYLNKLTSLYDLDVFNLNIRTDADINPDRNFMRNHIKCKYYSPESFTKIEKVLHGSSDSRFSFFHNNVCSLRRNLEHLQTQILDELDFSFSVIGITETRIKQNNFNDFNYNIAGYSFEFVPTPLAAGGVGMYINNQFNYVVIEKAINIAYQALWIEIDIPKKRNIICAVIYRQHNSPEAFQTYFEQKLEYYTSKGKHVVIMGDFNIDLLKIDQCNYAHNFMLSLQSCSMIPSIDKPTRVHRNSSTLIDNIFINNPDNISVTGNIISDVSDHFSQFCILDSIASVKQNIFNHKYRDYSQFSETLFNNELSEIDWGSILMNSSNNPSKAFSTFFNKFNKTLNKHAPFKTISKRKLKQSTKPWITKGIRRSIKIKNKLFRTNNNTNYKLYRNYLVTLIRLSKKLYYCNYFNSYYNNMSKKWEGIREILGRKSQNKQNINALRQDSNAQLTFDSKKISNIINRHFASCGQRLAAKIPHSEKHYSTYLPDQIMNSSVNVSQQQGSFAFIPVTARDIEFEIMTLPAKKAEGLYSCPFRILKTAQHVLSKPLADIFNCSIETGIYPSKLKIAKIIPIHKSDDESDPNNYRPISLLSSFNKIFEKIMYKRLQNYLDMKEFFCDSQYGFRKQHSTQHAILDIINRIQDNMDKKMYSCGIFIDLKKAFDTVDHDILLGKLDYYGIRGTINNWFSSYLKNRSQTTLVGNCISNKETTLCGVPQGSVLGPLLFLIYINDICQSSEIFNFFLFADDTNLLYANKDLKMLETVVNAELRKVCEWLAVNKLTLNISKSNFIIFRPYQKALNFQPVIKLFDNDTKHYITLECKEYVKYLGIIIDYNLNWKHHINYITLKISKTVGIISKLRYSIPNHTLLDIYRSLISPYLTYGVVVWGNAAKVHIQKLLILQKRALRLMFFKSFQDHAIPLFLSTNTLPVTMIYVKESANMLYDILKGNAPEALHKLFIKSSKYHNYDTRFVAKDSLHINPSRLEMQKRSFSRVGTLIWNSIDLNLRSSRKQTFKSKIHQALSTILKDQNDYVDVPMIIEMLPNVTAI